MRHRHQQRRHIIAGAALVVALAGALTACGRRVESFSLVGLADGPRRLTESFARPEEEEGLLFDGSTGTYSFTPIIAGAEVGQLAIRYEGDGAGLAVRLYDTDGALVAARALPEASSISLSGDSAVESTVAAVAIPAGAEVAGAEVRLLPEPERAEVEPGAGFLLTELEVGPRDSSYHTRSSAYVGAGVATHSVRRQINGVAYERLSVFLPDQRNPIELIIEGPDYADGTRYSTAEPPFEPVVAVVSAEAAEPTAASADRTLRLRSGANSIYLYPAQLGFQPQWVRIEAPADSVSVRSVRRADATGSGAPIPIDLGSLLGYPVSAWRSPDLEIFAWARYPSVLVLDTIDYEIQSRYLKRLAFFSEKRGYRGTLVSDAELAGRHGYNAHNYSAQSLADFFTLAAEQSFPLAEEELALRRLLLDAGTIRVQGETYAPGTGGLLSISRESAATPGLRELLLAHEAYHGIYYSEPEFVEGVVNLWRSLDTEVQRLFRLFLGAMHYDTSDSYLVENEFQAYVLQQPLASVPWYYETRVRERLLTWVPSETAWLQAFYATYRGVFYQIGVELNRLLFRLTGFTGGDVTTVVQ